MELFYPVDNYKNTERSVKYGILFIALTFIAFFLIEVLGKVSIHPLQYILVGAALLIFYILLLSISEQIEFTAAYLIASGVTILLIAFYCKGILKDMKRVFILSGLLIGLYSYLYILLQLEDYALLVGSIGLFVILSIIMLITRKINWYELNMNIKETLKN